VFKIKQKSQANYYDYMNQQAGRLGFEQLDDNSPLQFNWPYDYFSIIEFIDLDTSVLFNNEVYTPGKSTTIKYGGSITSQDILPPMSSAPAVQIGRLSSPETMRIGAMPRAVPTPQAVTYSQAGPMQAPTVVGRGAAVPSDFQAVAVGTGAIPDRVYVSGESTGRQAGRAASGRVAAVPAQDAQAPDGGSTGRGVPSGGSTRRGGSY
jgi:hypothetical protein